MAGSEKDEVAVVVAVDTVDANQIQALEQVEDQEAIDVDLDLDLDLGDQGSREEVLLDSLVEALENQVGHTDSMD